MPDITLCTGDGCRDKAVCYRHTAKPDAYQSYFLNPPSNNKELCSYYIDNKEKLNDTTSKRTNYGCSK